MSSVIDPPMDPQNFDPAATVGAGSDKLSAAAPTLHQNRKEKSIRGCSPNDSDVLKAKEAQFSSLPIHQKKKKSIQGCSTKDSGELKAKEARISSLPIQQNKENSIRGCSPKDSDVLKAKAMPQFYKNRKEKSIRGCSPNDSDVLKAKTMAQFSSLPIRKKKKKSIQGCSTKDSGELKAKEAQISSLPIQENREEISIWGCSLPKDSDELKAKAAQFSTLPIQEKLVCLMAASFTIQDYHEQLRRSREEEKDLLYYEGWTACLYKEELEMIGELDGKEAEKIYNESQEDPYDYFCFEVLLDENSCERMIQEYGKLLPYEDVESFYKGLFADREIEFNKQEAKSYILEDKLRKKMLEEYESYQMKMEEVMCKWIGQYFNKSDEGACSETKFNHQKRKETFEKKKMTG